jgi:hypothetical protein
MTPSQRTRARSGRPGVNASFGNGAAAGAALISFPAHLATGEAALTAKVTLDGRIWLGYLGALLASARM